VVDGFHGLEMMENRGGGQARFAGAADQRQLGAIPENMDTLAGSIFAPGKAVGSEAVRVPSLRQERSEGS